MLLDGTGVPKDEAEALKWFRRAADAGDLDAVNLDGRGVARDLGQAYWYYLRAAGQGQERAMNLVGRCCEHGWGTPSDPAAAPVWCQRSAEAGYFRGQYNWATVLLEQPRFEAAAIWFARTADGGPASMRAIVAAAVARAGAALRTASRLSEH